jgi:hypothetical protein
MSSSSSSSPPVVVSSEDYFNILKSMLTVQIISELKLDNKSDDSSSSSSYTTVVSTEDVNKRTNKKRRRCCASTVSGKKCRMYSLKEEEELFENNKYCTHHDKINKKHIIQQQSDSVAIDTANKWVSLIINIMLLVYSIIYLTIIFSNFNPNVIVNFLGPNLFNTELLKNEDNYQEMIKTSSFIHEYYIPSTPIIDPFSFELDDYMNQTF